MMTQFKELWMANKHMKLCLMWWGKMHTETTFISWQPRLDEIWLVLGRIAALSPGDSTVLALLDAKQCVVLLHPLCSPRVGSSITRGRSNKPQERGSKPLDFNGTWPDHFHNALLCQAGTNEWAAKKIPPSRTVLFNMAATSHVWLVQFKLIKITF